MAGQFRFRLPWLSAVAPAPRPIAEPPQPPLTTEIQAPPRPTTPIPVQRPPFRPAGVAPAQPPPPPVQAPPRTEPQPALPPRATTQPQAASVPSSPSRPTTRTRAGSVPPSPSRAAPEPQISPLPASPSRAAPQSRAASVPPSPSRTTFQPQAAGQTPARPKSPPRLASQRPGQTSSQPSSPTRLATQVQQLSRQEETKPQPEKEITSQTVPKYQAEPVQASPVTQALRKSTASQKLDSDIHGADRPEPMSEPEKRVGEKEGRRVVEELKREEKTSHAEQKQQKEEVFEKKKTTDSSNGEQMRTARARHAPSESHPKPVMSNGEKVPLYKEIREDISKFVHKLGTGLPKEAVGEKPVSILTLAGENKGATMHVGSEPAKKDGSIHIHRGYKSNPDDTTAATSDGEGISKARRPKDPYIAEEPARKPYVNSNTQGVNNSILFESSITGGNPGVHLNLSCDLAEPTKRGGKAGPLDTRKAEFNITPAEKHTYEPTVRRRCLRGLFLESSDSDPDNPEKPRRHGCRYGCAVMSKDKDIAL